MYNQQSKVSIGTRAQRAQVSICTQMAPAQIGLKSGYKGSEGSSQVIRAQVGLLGSAGTFFIFIYIRTQ